MTKLKTIAAIIIIISSIYIAVGSVPQYGAYPKSLHPSKVAHHIKLIVKKYSYPNLMDLSIASTRSFIFYLADSLMSETRFPNGDRPFNSTSLELDLCREIIKVSKNNKATKNLSDKVIKQFLDQRPEAFRIFQQIKDGEKPDYLNVSLYIFNTTWGINQSLDHMWLDSYRVPVLRLYLALSSCIDKNGYFKNAQPSPVTDAAFLLASHQIWLLTSAMSLPVPFVTSPRYYSDLEIQKRLIDGMPAPNRAKTISLMRQAAESQLNNTFTGSADDAIDADRSWYRGSFFAGIMAAWRATNDNWYLKQSEALAKRTKCEPGPNAMRDANDLAVSQTYLELYLKGNPFGQYRPTQVILDSLIRSYNPAKVEWSWCDALFMSPPVWTLMSKITGEKKYLEHMGKLWWQTTDLIFDDRDDLFYRDLTYTKQPDGFQLHERNQEKIFWGRGNGWVIGGLCRVLEYLPKDDQTRQGYERMFQKICLKLLKLQGNDGLWRTSLLDPDSYPMGETSSSTFYCYAFAWGINNGLLGNKQFMPSVLKAWKALCACVNPVSGRLEYVQSPADSPRSIVYKNSNVEYATGAFLLAGSEVLHLLKESPVTSATSIRSGERNILSKQAESVDLSKQLVSNYSWNSLPVYQNRDFWENLPTNLRLDYIDNAKKYLDYNWPAIKATDYLEFIRTGDRRQQVYAACSDALISLVMGELIEGKGRFLDNIINGVWFYSEQSWWGWSACLSMQKAGAGLPDINEPIVDLGVGEVVNNLSWIWFLFKDQFDKVHPLISKRLKQEIINKALVPYFTRDDFRYMGFKGGRPNNWNPWVNYNLLNSFLIIESDSSKRIAIVKKIISSLDKFVNGYPDDGGCDEGPGYWNVAGALLFENLDLLKNATGGKFDVFDDPLIQNMGKYFYKANIHAPYFINFADAGAMTGANASTVFRYGKAIKDPRMQQFGGYLARLDNWGEVSLKGRICDQLRSLAVMNEILVSEAKEALVADFWLPDTEISGARDAEGSYKGFFFGAKGGNNNESHNHNDVGSCVMYFDGKPCLIDLGHETYTARTFGIHRYENWIMQSGYHNLPVINGKDQKEGGNFKAKNSNFVVKGNSAIFSTDISGAYPKEAQVKSWIRCYMLERGANFIISDKYKLNSSDLPTSSNLVTYCKVLQVKPGLLQFEGEGFTLNMTYNPKNIKPRIEYIQVKDISLQHAWPKGVTRVVLEFIKPEYKGKQEYVFTPKSNSKI